MAARQGAEPQRAAGVLGEHDRAALGIERADGVVQNRMEQVFFVFQAAQVMAGPQQGEQLFAGARAAVAIEGDAADRVFPRVAGDGFDQEMIGRGGVVPLFSALLEIVNDERDVAAAENIVNANRPLARSQAGAVEKGAVGAAQIADAPTLPRAANFSVAAADGGVVEDDFECVEAAGAQETFRFPDLAFDVAVDATQTDALFHRSTPRESGRCRRRQSVPWSEGRSISATIACKNWRCITLTFDSAAIFLVPVFPWTNAVGVIIMINTCLAKALGRVSCLTKCNYFPAQSTSRPLLACLRRF